MNRHFLILITLLSIQFQKVFPSEVTENKIEHSLLTKAGKTTQNSSANCNILIWGGGYSPSGNQVSLESNVRYFLRVRDKMGLTGFQTRILLPMVQIMREIFNFEILNFWCLKQIYY